MVCNYHKNMKVAGKIKERINLINEGKVFTYNDLRLRVNEYTAAAKYLERLTKKGVIKRVSKGVFYKPRRSIFGEITPTSNDILKLYLYKNNRRVAYITGTALYNKMGLTTQIPKEIKIASSKRFVIDKGKVRATTVKSYVDVNDNNVHLLEILDAIKDFKIIPDINRKEAIRILENNIKKLQDKDLKRLIKYSLSYPPRTRALLGALLEDIGINQPLEKLKTSLNPFTKYKLGINDTILPTASKWNVV